MFGLKILCEISKGPLKFHTKFWTHTPQNMHFTLLYFCVLVMISLNCDVISLSETGPSSVLPDRCGPRSNCSLLTLIEATCQIIFDYLRDKVEIPPLTFSFFASKSSNEGILLKDFLCTDYHLLKNPSAGSMINVNTYIGYVFIKMVWFSYWKQLEIKCTNISYPFFCSVLYCLWILHLKISHIHCIHFRNC